MKISSLLATIAVACAFLMSGPSARAQYSITFADTSGDPGSVTIAPGDLFNVTLTLVSQGAASIGLSYFLQVLEGGGNGLFRITARNLSGSSFSDATTDDSIALQSADALLDPRNNSNLGATVVDPNSPNGAGSFFIASFTLQALAGIAPGVYTLSTADVVVTDSAFGDNPVGDASYGVTIVPEPSTYCLLGAGLLFGAARSVRRFRRNTSLAQS